MSEKQIVQAFKAFFQKSVLPNVNQNDQILRQWNHLNKIISSSPIDYSQIQFYLLLANKAASNSNVGLKPTVPHVPSHPKVGENDNRYKRNQYGSPIISERYPDKKNSQISQSSNKRKTLMNSLEIFQKLLSFNQQKLEMLTKKEMGGDGGKPGLNTSVNGLHIRRF